MVEIKACEQMLSIYIKVDDCDEQTEDINRSDNTPISFRITAHVLRFIYNTNQNILEQRTLIKYLTFKES